MTTFTKSIFKFFLITIAFIFVGAVGVVGIVSYISLDLPEIKSIADYHPDLPSQILSKDGRVLLEIGREKRHVVMFEQIPPLIINSILAAEDDNFFQHKGIEYSGMIRALIQNIKEGRVAQGGSTITQQVAKSLLKDKSRSILRKIKDVLLAQKIEERLTKKEILFLYLNQIYLGGGYYGVKAAFEGYFDKELTQVTPAESAIVAGLLVAPGKYSPYVNPLYAKKRQLYVLGRMLETKVISKAQYDVAVKEKLKFRIKNSAPSSAGYFTDWIRQLMIESFGEEDFLTEGYKILTTLDWDLQQVAEEEVLKGVKEVDKRQGYTGAISNLANDEAILNYQLEQRKELFLDYSAHFYLLTNGEKQYEHVFNEEEFSNYILRSNDNSISSEGLVLGNQNTDSLFSLIEENKEFKAVVVRVSDKRKLIFVSIGGIIGIIPLEGFQWAYPRKISEETTYASLQNIPSRILKRGDIVFVNVLKKESGPWNYISSTYKGQNLSKDLELKIKSQKYMITSLEQNPEIQGALLSINPKNGQIYSFVGGTDFSKSQFNRVVQSARQPGSSFKPFIFASALENGVLPSDIILDSPEALGGYDDGLSWKPKNYDNEFHGPVTLRTVVEESRNVPTVKLAEKLGIRVIEDFLKRIQFDAILPPDLSISLGSFGISLYSLVSAYSIFPNGGKRVVPKYILSIMDRNGKKYSFEELIEKLSSEKNSSINNSSVGKETIENENKSPIGEVERSLPNSEYLQYISGDQVYDPRLAFIMVNLLKGVIQSPNGTARNAKTIGNNIAGKTGTTSNYVDAWFMGFSNNVVTGVWTGFDENKTMGWSESGSRAALPIWMNYMKSALQKFGDNDFPVPHGITFVQINKKTGRLATENDPDAFLESFVTGTGPGTEDTESLSKGVIDPSKRIMEEDDYFSNQ